MRNEDLTALRAAHLDEIQRRYEPILAAHGLDAIILQSGARHLRRHADDQYCPLLPVPHFAHFIPLAEPDCLIVVRPGRAPRLVRLLDESFWEQLPEPEVPFDGLDLVEIREAKAAESEIPAGRVALVCEPGAAILKSGRFADADVNPAALLKALDGARTLKTPYEIACLAEANRRAAAGHRRLAEEFAASDASELELHLVYLAVTRQDDPETPYKNIVAKGAHAATLHHVTYTKRGEPAGSLLVDAGATFRGYASDITRTHVRGASEAADRFRALVAGVDAMQQRMCAAVEIGLPYEQLHDRSHVEIASVLREVGLVRASVDEAVGNGITRAFFPHGLGHSLGIQTHDVGCAEVKPRPENPFLRNTSPVAAGQVFTIEPGVYFIRSLLGKLQAGPNASAVDWSVVEQLAPYGGVRIEDDLFIDADGVRNLTREALG